MKDKIQYCASLNRLIEEWHQYNKTVLKQECNNCNFKELCETMNELKGEIDYLCKANGKLLKDKDNLLTAHKKLEQELVELKQKKAIVPKFNIGTILYMIPTQFNGLTKIKDYHLLSISLSDIGVRYDMAVNKKESGIEPFYCASEDMFGKSIFTTREEAEQKLAEIKERNMCKIEELTKWFEDYGVIIPDGSKATIKDFMCGCEIETMSESLYEDFIADLQHRLDVAEEALDLACLEISRAMCPNKDWYLLKKDFANKYKQQAEKELKGE